MTSADPESTTSTATIAARSTELFREQQQSIVHHTDQIFVRLMAVQWLFGIALAVWISPRTWAGTQSQIHLHVWAAVFLGGLLTGLPVFLGITQPGRPLTRHTIAVGQMLMSALLIHLTGGRIETHFHIFGSLAILAFYRDWRVLVTGALVVFADHLIRGFIWPESVYGVAHAPVWRSLEHAGWVVFEVAFLIISIRKSRSEMRLVAERQARLEALKNGIERTVADRTADLTREIEERRQVEQNLRESQTRLAQAQQIARMGSWEWDLIANQVTCSDETQRIYARQPEESGSPMEICLKRVHPDDLARVNQTISDAIRSRSSFVCEHRIILPDGRERVIEGRGEIVVNAHGEPVRMLGVVHDMTENRRAAEALVRSEEQLRQSQKMEAIGRLAGGVAHDFNNLLTVIGGYSALSLLSVGPAHPLRKHLVEIQKSAERAASLTGQLLAFSRKQVLQPRILQLNEVVRGLEKMLRRLIGEDIELSTKFDPGLGCVKADPGQIEQVLMNLSVNARDAMPRGGKLTLATENVTIDHQTRFHSRTLEPGRYVMLSVSDNGMGMSAEVKTHLFEPFFTTKGLGKGTGLGLATCHGIITQSGGDIHVYSEPESGTTFKIYLPRTDAAPATAAAPDAESLPGGAESVLVVEDDPAVRNLAVVILRQRGYQVEQSNNAFEALEVLKKNPRFDLVVTDVIMPQMSGKELCDRIHRNLPQTRVLLMSGYTDDALAHHGVLDEGLSFLEKPFSPARLSRKVRDVLDRPAPAQRASSDSRLEPAGV